MAFALNGKAFSGSVWTVDAPGQILAGKYQLFTLAGHGGMGDVWRGLTLGALDFKRPVAIKRIRPELTANREFVKLFVEEARVLSKLTHPNIVQAHDFGIDDEGGYYIVMEWVEGIDLAKWAQGHTLHGEWTPWNLVAAIGIEMLRGLSAAHQLCDTIGHPSPVFHRDVTPHNVLLGVNGTVKLSDFGLARATDRARLTAPHTIKGKLGYSAPELTHGGNSPSAQSDVYSAGIVLWESLAGRHPFDHLDAAEMVARVRAAKIDPIGRWRPDLPSTLATVVHRALSLSPGDRFPSAMAMGRALADALRGSPERSDSYAIAHNVDKARARFDTSLPWLGDSTSVDQTAPGIDRK